MSGSERRNIEMKPTDPILIHLATLARVRPPHVYHLWATMKQQKERFNPTAYAAFASLEIQHVQRMTDVLKSEGIFDTSPEHVKGAAQGGRLPKDFAMPADWIAWAQAQRFWTTDVCETVAAEFSDYWHSQPGQRGVKLDWFATWRNWVRRSRQPNGERAPARQSSYSIPTDPAEFVTYCKEKIASASQIRNFTQIRIWREKLEKAEAVLNASC